MRGATKRGWKALQQLKAEAGPKQASQEEHENRNPEWSLEDSVRVERH